MGLSRDEAATVLTALCRRKLVEAGYTVAAFGINADEVKQALEQRLGLGPQPEPPPAPVFGVVEPLPAAVRQVWDAWVALRGLPPETPIDVKSRLRIEERLAYGFSAEDLVAACAKVHNDPALVKRTTVRTITKPLESDLRVCQLLGRAYERPQRVTWLTPFEELWRKHYPTGEVPFGPMAKSLAPLVDKHGAEAVLAEAEQYLAATNIAYLSWPKFAQGFGTWTYGSPAKRGRESYAADAVSHL